MEAGHGPPWPMVEWTTSSPSPSPSKSAACLLPACLPACLPARLLSMVASIFLTMYIRMYVCMYFVPFRNGKLQYSSSLQTDHDPISMTFRYV